MPVYRCRNNKYRIGSGKCMYTSRASANRAYRAYLASRYAKKTKFDEESKENPLDK